MPKPENEPCKSCQFYIRDNKYNDGLCHAELPKQHVYHYKDVHEELQHDVWTGWPAVYPSDWCGFYQLEGEYGALRDFLSTAPMLPTDAEIKDN